MSDQYDEFDDYEDEDDQPKGGFTDALQEQFGAAPWWVVSTVLHALVLAILALIIISVETQAEDTTIIQSEMPPKEIVKEKKKIRDIFKSEKVVENNEEIVETPMIVHEKVEITNEVETENDMDMQSAQGQEEAISDIPLGGTGVSGAIGAGGGGAGAFGFRTGGGRTRAALRNGGSRKSENAVDAALEWLARHQEADGSWLCKKHEGSMSDEVSVGLTGLATLAFLGAGHTEQVGKFKSNVRRGIAYLISRQDARGMVGQNSGHGHGGGYNHAIAGLALAEAWGMSGGKSRSTGVAAQKAMDYSVLHHQRDYGGWRYGPKAAGDLSVSGWYIMQLKSGKVAGLKVPGQAWQGAIQFLDSVEVKEAEHDGYEGGLFKYMPNKDHWGTQRSKARISSVGILGRLFLGYPPSDMIGGGNLLIETLPKWEEQDFYYWYYGTLDMFQMGGDFWQQWNPAMRDMLVTNQRRGGDEDGSWDPNGDYSKRSGRVFSTAVGALCLEVYYRYLPMYK
jgi:hypothetical protein